MPSTFFPWTVQLPRVAGYYWYRTPIGDYHVVRIERDVHPPHKLCLFFHGSGATHRLPEDVAGGRWWGPLDRPPDPDLERQLRRRA